MRTTGLLFQFGTAGRRKKFMDSLRIYVKAGSGGSGSSKYDGIGGNGGSIWVQAEPEKQITQSLKQMFVANPAGRYEGIKGGSSVKMAIQGSTAPDTILDVPLGVVCIDDETGEVLGEINKKKDRVCLATGGEGGNRRNQYLSQPGQKRFVRLDLKLLADVGLVGFPNAGKSTLLASISRAQPRIAAFPFTTIKPELGVLEYDDFRTITMADLPGLIEGSHKNLGLGHRFLRHVERTRLLMFVIDINGFQLSASYPHRTAFETLVLLNKELELYKESLTDKPAMLTVNKMDTPGAEKAYEKFVDLVRNYEEVVSDLDESVRPKYPISFDEVIPISGLKHYNIDMVKSRVREIIDHRDELEREEANPSDRLPRGVLPEKERATGLA